MRIVRSVRLSIVLGIILVAPGGHIAAAQAPPEEPPGGPPENARPGDTVRDYRVTLRVPPKGERVWVHSLFPDGIQSLGIETGLDESVTFHNWGDDQAAQAAEEGEVSTASGYLRCDDTSNNPTPGEWYTQFDWYYNDDGLPSNELVPDNALQALRNATSMWFGVWNDCGILDTMSGSSLYKGLTTRVSGSRSTGCVWDGFNVVDWKRVSWASENLGSSCNREIFYGGTWTIAEGDFFLNTYDTHWTANPGPGCSGKWDVQSIAAHERGHNLGMGHVYCPPSCNLVMKSSGFITCTTYDRRLGRGDAMAINSKY